MIPLLLSLPMLCLTATTQEPPAYVIKGMLYTETRSILDDSGHVKRGDWSNDRDSLGCLQIRPIAFRDVQSHFVGKTFAEVATDDKLSIQACKWYLIRYYRGSWDDAVMAWNAGPRHKSYAYLAKVKKYGCKP